MSLVKVEELVCGYDPKNPVIKGLSFAVHDGEFVGIVGPNGSGKTTLLRALTGLLKAESGTIMLGRQQLDELGRRAIARQVAFVPQLMEPVEGFSVEEMVYLGRIPYFERFSFAAKEDHKAVKWAVEEVKIEGLKGREVTELSGGEFQRVALARALAQKPKVLLLDEPTSHLDIRYQLKLCRLLRKLKSSRSIVATFHDLNLAARYCTRLILIKNGKIVAAGVPKEVLTAANIWQAYRVRVIVRSNPKTKRAKYVVLP